MDGLTLDQFSVFLAIVDEGSFAAAARRLNRAQSAVTYAIQKLEDNSGVVLFDRSAYRPGLTEAGRALLPRARRIVEGVADYRLQARGIANGLEASLSLVIDAMVPMAFLIGALKAFHQTFPAVQVRIVVEVMGAAAQLLDVGSVDVGVLPDMPLVMNDFERHFGGEIDLVPVAAPDHPLALRGGPIEPDVLRDHVQLVLTTRSMLSTRDFGIHAANLWHLTDLPTKRRLLMEGLGWGSMPRHMVASDLNGGRLVELAVTSWEGRDRMPKIPFVVAFRRDKSLGPAGRWLVGRLSISTQSRSA